jgi:protein-disulfide isomerase
MNHKLSIPLSIFIAALIIGGSLHFSDPERRGAISPTGLSFAEQAAQARNAAKPPAIVPTADDDAGVGSVQAPVTMIEFSDYRCPFCAKFTTDIESAIKEKYIDTGKVRLVYRDFAILGSESVRAAEAAECAGDQGKYAEYHDALFAAHTGGHPDFPPQQLSGFAKALGLHVPLFESCVSENKNAAEVEKDLKDGQAAGVTGTPTFFINGKKIVGALPLSTFESAIEEALSSAR